MRRPANILLLSILIGALASALIYRYVSTQQSRYEAALNAAKQQGGTGAALPVVVANDHIPIGSTIELAQLKTVSWPPDAQPEGAVTDTAQLVGRVARTNIERNQPVTQALIVSDKAGLLPLLITEGMRGMSVKVDKVTGVSGFITPSSRVDVLLAGTPKEGDDLLSKVILQNVTVLATGTEIELRDNKPVEVPTVTLLLSPEDAEKLTLATREGAIQLALRNFRDEDTVITQGVTAAGLFGRPKAAAPAPPPPAPRAPRQRAPGYSVEVLLGDQMTRQGL